MSIKEIDRVPTLERLARKEIKIGQAASILGISIRQVKRIKKRFTREGKAGLIHLGRGKPSNRLLPKTETDRILRIIKERYSGFGPTLALEKLKENHGATLSRETLRKLMASEDLWQPKKRKVVVTHQCRRRREREGELVQIDGSPYRWFGEEGPYCTLLVFIDDATGKLKHLAFAEAETTQAYFEAVGWYLKAWGKPLAFYLDRHGVFRVNTAKNGLAATPDESGPTQFGRAMRELGITLIFANSPQAKGRVERANLTLQDRLAKELRLRGITTIEEGNRYLPLFILEFNARFAVLPTDATDAHRPLLPSEHPEKTLVIKEVRRLSRNLEFQFENILYQVRTKRPAYALRHAPVMVTKDGRETVAAYYHGQKLEISPAAKFPRARIIGTKELYPEVERLTTRAPWKPPEGHPWRRAIIASR